MKTRLKVYCEPIFLPGTRKVGGWRAWVLTQATGPLLGKWVTRFSETAGDFADPADARRAAERLKRRIRKERGNGPSDQSPT